MCTVRAKAFYKAVTVDSAGVLEQILDLLTRLNIPYCVVGGQAVNAYVDPLVSLDLDLVVALDSLPRSFRPAAFSLTSMLAVPPGGIEKRFFP